jgi:long-subunit fatty acid transport protein
VYAVYKKDKFAFSLGFMPIGGGGGATYEKGLPSFEMSQSDLVPSLASSMGATAYDMDVFFEGSSLFLGFQAGVSYKIADFISIAAGARYVSAKNTYTGYLKSISVNTASGWLPAPTIMTGIAANAETGGNNLQPIIDNGAGGFTANQLLGAGQITQAQRDAIVGGLTALGVQNAASLTITQSQQAFYYADQYYTNRSTLLSDQEADAEQTGSGIAPFFSVNISPVENLNIAIKYEMATKLELENNTTKDIKTGFLNEDPTKPITKFPDGAKVRNDMPAMLAVGAELKLSKFNLAAGVNYYFDKNADYGHTYDATLQNSSDWPVPYTNEEIIEKNGFAIQAGAEYNISDKLLVSAGYAWANKGVNSKYQSDLTFANATNTIGLGGAYTIKDRFTINIGGAYTMYKEDEKVIGHFLGTAPVTCWETYTKNTMIVGVGLDLRF